MPTWTSVGSCLQLSGADWTQQGLLTTWHHPRFSALRPTQLSTCNQHSHHSKHNITPERYSWPVFIYLFITQSHSVAKNVGCFQRNLFVCVWVCVFVGVFVNTITSEWVNAGRWNLGLGALYRNLGQIRIWGSQPYATLDSNRMSHWNLSDHSITFARWRHIPSLLAQSLQRAVTRVLQRVACGYDVGKISAGCMCIIWGSQPYA